MYKRVIRADKNGKMVTKIVRSDGTYPPSASPEHRKAYYESLKIRIFDILGHVCCKCSFSDKRALQFDHVDGGGIKKMKGKTGGSYFHAILEGISRGERFQTLCANCNWIKRHENGEHPVGRRRVCVKG